jgi:hypothetical protein
MHLKGTQKTRVQASTRRKLYLSGTSLAVREDAHVEAIHDADNERCHVTVHLLLRGVGVEHLVELPRLLAVLLVEDLHLSGVREVHALRIVAELLDLLLGGGTTSM